MSFEKPRSPKEVRTKVQTAYDDYRAGRRMFPKGHYPGLVEDLPHKTQRTAALLEAEWERIHEDRAMYTDAVIAAVELAKRNPGNASSLVAIRIGRNAVGYAHVSFPEGATEPVAYLGEFDRRGFLESFGGMKINLGDGRTVTLGETVEGEPDAAIIRSSNPTLIFSAAEPVETIMDLIPNEPINF